MPDVIEMIGLVAGVIELVKALRDLIFWIYKQASNSCREKSSCYEFVNFLKMVEDMLEPYKNPWWENNSAMRWIVEKVGAEIDKARKLATDFKSKKSWWIRLKPRKFQEHLKESQDAICRFLYLIPIAAGPPAGPPTAQDGHAHSGNEDFDLAIALSLSQEEQRKANSRGGSSEVDGDEELAGALQASLDIGFPPRSNQRPIYPSTYGYPTEYKVDTCKRICAGCNNEIGDGRFLRCMRAVWHPKCFRCHGCCEPISEHKFKTSGNDPYHKSCYKELRHRKCDVCNRFLPTNSAGLSDYKVHPFWTQRYCPSHEHDNTTRCCSCERMQPRNVQYVSLDDGRKLCLECRESAIMNEEQWQSLYSKIKGFCEGMKMTISQQVEKQALNEAMQGEKEIARGPRIGGNRNRDMSTKSGKCEVTTIPNFCGLPRLQTGSILANKLMHAWLHHNVLRTLSPGVEEGICQVLSHMWLESKVMARSGSTSHGASTSSGISSSSSSKKGVRSQFEKKLGKFFMFQIKQRDDFRAGYAAKRRHGLEETLNHIQMTGSFP